MRVFVTGASGHVASAVVPELLAAGHAVTGLARSDGAAARVEALGGAVRRGDLADLDVLGDAARNADGVIHLAFDHGLQRAGDLAGAAAADLRAIDAIGAALAGTGRPLVGTNATGALALAGFSGLLTEDVALPGGPRIDAENRVIALARRGVRSSVVRLPPAVHGDGRFGFVSGLVEIARGTGVSGYPGDGGNRWPSTDVRDAARLYRLALESAPAGTRLHAVADAGTPMVRIARAVGERLGVPLAPVADADRFGPLRAFVVLDNPVSSEATRSALGWVPTGPGLVEALTGSGAARHAGTVLNVGLAPSVVGAAPSAAFPTVDAAEVRAGLAAAARDLAPLDLGFESCLLDGGAAAETALRDVLARTHYEIIVFGGGVRLEPAMTPLFEKLVDVARVHAPTSVLCFDTGPDTILDAVRRWWPPSR